MDACSAICFAVCLITPYLVGQSFWLLIYLMAGVGVDPELLAVPARNLGQVQLHGTIGEHI